MANPMMSPAAAAAQAAVPMIAAPKPRGGKKGLVLGLSGAGLAAVAVIVVMLVRSNKPTDDPGPLGSVVTAQSTSGGPAAVSAEIPQDTATQASTGTPSLTPTLPANPQHKSTTGKATATHTGTATATATPAPSQTAPNPNPVPVTVPSTTPAQPTQPPPSNPACDACMAAASRGDIAGAARNYSGCTNPSVKESCGSSIRRGATEAAKVALRSHDCAKLQSIKAALDGAGISAPAVASAANNCR
jgi:hypothetical protein